MNSRGSRRIRDAFTERFCTGPGRSLAPVSAGCRPLSPVAGMLGIGNNSGRLPRRGRSAGPLFSVEEFHGTTAAQACPPTGRYGRGVADVLWDKYAQTVQRFEPSERWQEAVLVLSFIQAKRWKNQLFNAQWAARTRNAADGAQAPGLPPQSAFTLEKADESLDAPRRGTPGQGAQLPSPHKLGLGLAGGLTVGAIHRGAPAILSCFRVRPQFTQASPAAPVYPKRVLERARVAPRGR